MPVAQVPANSVLPSGARIIIIVSSGPSALAPGAYVVMPELLGKSQGKALAQLQEEGLSAQVFNDYSDAYKRGDVIGQLPAGGVGVPAGAEVVLLISSGKASTPSHEQMLPDVIGQHEAQAVSTLQGAGFSPQIVRRPSATVPAGVVEEQLPSRGSLASTSAKKGTPWWVWALLAAVLVVAGLVAAFALGGSKTVMVPDLVGLTQAEAVKVLEAAGLGVTVVAAPEGDPGVVTSQDPAAGSEVGKSSVVQIAVFQGTELTAVPDVRGKNQSEATRALQDAGFEVRVTRKDSAFVDKGLVIEQDPAGGDGAPQGSTVSIVISSGPAQNNVSVPDVEGLTRADAQSMLLNLGLKVVVAENPSTEVATDVVIAQLPAAGDSVAPGTSIGIVVSTGPPTTVDQVPTPDVVGITLADAQQVISDAGLEAIPVVSVGSGKPANQVVAQTPAAGVQTQVGSKVVLFYSSGP